jgi:putative folate metabolism gamma-glutamate ligase
MKVSAHKTHKIQIGEDLFTVLDTYLPKLEEKSIVAITSKIIAISQGDVIKDDGIIKKDDIVKKEADYYIEYPVDTPYGKTFLTRKNNLLVFTAGVDKSNSGDYYVLWPKNLQEITNKIWKYLRKKHQLKHLGIIVTDSRLIPSRTGVVGFGLSWCGFSGLNDYIGKPDIYGQPITMTKVNLVESFATSAVFVMGETNEQTPLAVIQDAPFVTFQDRTPTEEELNAMTWPVEKDMYGKLLTSVKWKKGGK